MKVFITISLALAFVASGCCRNPKAVTPLRFYVNSIEADLSSLGWLSAYNNLPESTTDQQIHKANERNRLINEFMWLIDSSYNSYENCFYGSIAMGQIAQDFLQLGLTGATTLTGNAHTKTILALIASTAIGAKNSVDAHWYDQQSRSAIVSEMRALRLARRIDVETGMKLNLQSYSLEQGLVDLEAYFEAGTITAALQEIQINAGAQTTTSRQTLRQIRQQRREQ